MKLVHDNGAWQNSHAQQGTSAWHNLFMSSQQRDEIY